MHELGIATSIVEIAEDYARREGAQAVRVIALRVGALSGVVPEALEFAFEVAKMGTIAEEARLEVDHVPLVLYCAACQEAFTAADAVALSSPQAICPRCAEPSMEIRQGEELEVRYLEVI